MKKLAFFTSILLLLGSWLNLSAAPVRNITGDDMLRKGTFLIRGKVCNEVKKHGLQFAVSDPLSNEGHQFDFKSDGSFNMHVPMRGPVQSLYLYIDNVIIVPVHQGDTVNLEITDDEIILSSPNTMVDRDLRLSKIIHDKTRKRMININRDYNSYLSESHHGREITSRSDSLKQETIMKYYDYKERTTNLIDTFIAQNGSLRDEYFFRVQSQYGPGNFVGEFREVFPIVSHADSLMFYQDYLDFVQSYLNHTVYNLITGQFANVFEDNVNIREARVMRDIVPSTLLADWLDTQSIRKITKFHRPEFAKVCSTYFLNSITDDALRNEARGYMPELEKICRGAKAPAITLLDMDGKKYTLKDFRGKYLYLDFYSYTCGPCIQEFAEMEKFREMFADVIDKVHIVTVCDDPGSKEKFEKFTAKHSMKDLNLTIDLKNSDQAYHVTGYPTYILIDPEGKIVEFNTDRPSTIMGKSKYENKSTFEKELREIK